MVPVSGLAVAFAFVVGAVFGRVSAEAKGNAAAGVLADLASRASSGGGGGDNTTFIPMTEEQPRRLERFSRVSKVLTQFVSTFLCLNLHC